MATTPVFSDEQIASILDLINTTRHTQYIGARYVPIFGRKGEATIEWDNTAPYEPLTVVLHQGNSYTSRQYVPTGIDILNEDFWANTGNYNAQIEQYRQTVEQYKAEVETFDQRITNNTTSAKNANDKLSAMGIDTNEDGTDFLNRVDTIDNKVTFNKSLFNAMGVNNTTDATAFKTEQNNLRAISRCPKYAIFIGDSWTYGVGTGVDHNTNSFAIQLATMLQTTPKNYAVGSTGYAQPVYGRSTFAMQLDEAIADNTYNHNDVGYVFIMGGFNDRWGNKTADEVGSACRSICDKAATNYPNAKIIVIGFNDLQGLYCDSRTRELANAISVNARNSNRAIYIDNPAITFNNNLGFCIDDNHPNATGYKILAKSVFNSINSNNNGNSCMTIPWTMCTYTREEKNVKCVNTVRVNGTGVGYMDIQQIDNEIINLINAQLTTNKYDYYVGSIPAANYYPATLEECEAFNRIINNLHTIPIAVTYKSGEPDNTYLWFDYGSRQCNIHLPQANQREIGSITGFMPVNIQWGI